MEITIKLTYNQLTELIKALQEDRILLENTSKSIAERANRDLFNSVMRKLLKKQISKSELQTPNNTFSMKFQYYAAFSLWQNLLSVDIRDNYRMAICMTIRDYLHQNLMSYE